MTPFPVSILLALYFFGGYRLLTLSVNVELFLLLVAIAGYIFQLLLALYFCVLFAHTEVRFARAEHGI